MASASLLATFVVIGLITVSYLLRRNPRRILPPGPRKLPLVGNLFQIPTSFQWETYAQWGRLYNSDILHVDVAGTSLILVNSHRAANDLFDKRSSIYSSRPRFPMLNELIGWKWVFSFMAYGDTWREQRRLFLQHFHASNVGNYQPQVLQSAHKLVHQFLETPDDFMDHTRNMIGTITLVLAYGINVLPVDDPHVEIAEKALQGLVATGVPGAFLVDSIPLLKYVPEWMPGAGFKKQAKYWAEWTAKMLEVPFAAAEREIAEGVAVSSFTSLSLDEVDEGKDVEHQRDVIQKTAGAVFVGGSDTTVSALNTFILAMLCHPEVQAKAQEELDRVVGRNRLPGFNDEASLPYISSIVKEVLRWHPVAPFAIPHYLSEDDEYKGYHLPAHSIVIGNAWAMLHDESEYPEPSRFRPERFIRDGQLNPNVRDPASAAFGFGRRVCPAAHIAQDAVWIVAALVLATFDITKSVNKDGVPVEPSREYSSALVCHPLPFQCSIKPRSAGAEQLIRSEISE